MDDELREFMGSAQDHASYAEGGVSMTHLDRAMHALLAVAYSNLALARLQVLESEEEDG